MNNYIKMLAIGGGIIGSLIPASVAPINNNLNADFNEIYETIQDINSQDKQSNNKIKYSLNVDTFDSNVKFVNADSEQTLTEQETISYLNSNLTEVNTEYEQLKQTLLCAIKDTMDYIDQYDENNTLTNEEKIYIKSKSNEIKYLAETLENLSESVISAIDGCEDCNDDNKDFQQLAGNYMTAINNLEERIIVLQNSLNNLNILNSTLSSYARTYPLYPNNMIWGLRYGFNPSLPNNDLNNDTTNDNNNSSGAIEINPTEDSDFIQEDSKNDIQENNENDIQEDASDDDINNIEQDNLDNTQQQNNLPQNELDSSIPVEDNINNADAEDNVMPDNENREESLILDNETADSNISPDTANIDESANTDNTDINDTNSSTEEESKSTIDTIETENKHKNIDTMKSFLKSNIDTYGPTKRNIDTFFNTALLDNELMYGGGNMGMYGHGAYGGYGGYGMPYGGYGYGGMNNGYNSNLINKKALEDNVTVNGVANIDEETVENKDKSNLGDSSQNDEEIKSPKKHIKRAKNVDTYMQTTVEANINTMGESKIAKFFKNKFAEIKNKVQNKKNKQANEPSTEETIVNNETNTPDEQIDKEYSLVTPNLLEDEYPAYSANETNNTPTVEPIPQPKATN